VFTNLLQPLFGTDTPSDLARSTQGRWDGLRPISEAAPAGEDLAYDDDFRVIKDEVAKLSDVDDELIVSAAERLLKHSAKDVRVATCYVYARMRRDGAEGVADGMELLSALVDRFGETLLPERAQTRKAALEWLACSTFANRLDRVVGFEDVLLERTLSALALITERTATWPEAGRPDLSPLLRRFEDSIEALQPAESSPRHQPASLPAANEVASTRDLLDRTRQMAAFLRNLDTAELAFSPNRSGCASK
jgi:type VI secretion system protein VasJ